MRAAVVAAFALSLIAACGGGGGQPAGDARSGRPGQSTAVVQPSTPVAVPGAGTATVVLTGGPDAGTYTGSENPNCSQGIIGPGGWGTQYSSTTVGDKGLGSIQIISAAPGKENDPNAFMSGVTLLTTVTIGPSLGDSSRDYEIRVSKDDQASGTGTAQVTDNGATAVIRVTGTTKDGVTMDVTVNCPSITRT